MAAVMKKCCAQVLKASSAETSENAEQDLCLALSLLVSRLLQATRNGHPPKKDSNQRWNDQPEKVKQMAEPWHTFVSRRTFGGAWRAEDFIDSEYLFIVMDILRLLLFIIAPEPRAVVMTNRMPTGENPKSLGGEYHSVAM